MINRKLLIEIALLCWTLVTIWVICMSNVRPATPHIVDRMLYNEYQVPSQPTQTPWICWNALKSEYVSMRMQDLTAYNQPPTHRKWELRHDSFVWKPLLFCYPHDYPMLNRKLLIEIIKSVEKLLERSVKTQKALSKALRRKQQDVVWWYIHYNLPWYTLPNATIHILLLLDIMHCSRHWRTKAAPGTSPYW